MIKTLLRVKETQNYMQGSNLYKLLILLEKANDAYTQSLLYVAGMIKPSKVDIADTLAFEPERMTFSFEITHEDYLHLKSDARKVYEYLDGRAYLRKNNPWYVAMRRTKTIKSTNEIYVQRQGIIQAIEVEMLKLQGLNDKTDNALTMPDFTDGHYYVDADKIVDTSPFEPAE